MIHCKPEFFPLSCRAIKALYGILLIGVISSLGLVATNPARYKFITVECNIDAKFFDLFEVITFVIVAFLRVISFILFMHDAWSFLKTRVSISWKKLLALFIATSVSAGFATGTAVIGYLRDMEYVSSMCNSTFHSKYTLIDTLHSQYTVIDAHTTAKAFAYFSVLAASVCAVGILYSSVRKWKNGFPNITNQWCHRIKTGQSLTSAEIAAGDGVGTGAGMGSGTGMEGGGIETGDGSGMRVCAGMGAGAGTDNTLSDFVYDKFYDLHTSYIKVGKDTLLERKALRRWFVLMYFMYLIFILVHLVHLLLLKDRNKYHYDIAEALLNIFLHFLAFVLPYSVANWHNLEHQNYQRKMMEAYLEIRIKLTDSVWSVTYLCKPSSVKYEPNHEPLRVEVGSSANERCPLEMSEQNADARYKERVKKLYKKYCLEALVVQGTNSINLRKNVDFDFVPSFLNISIPLDSAGYTFTILLTVVSIVFNFVE